MPKNPEQHIGHKIAEAIVIKGTTQAALARHFKVAPATVNGDWIKRGTIGKDRYRGLVEFFELPYEYWFGDTQIDAKLRQLLTLVLSAWPRLGDREKLKLLAAVTQITEERVAAPRRPAAERA